MNTLEDFYDRINQRDFDCNSTSEISTILQELYTKLTTENKPVEANLCDFERQIFSINKSFKFTKDEDKGTVNGLSWTFSGTQTFEDGTEQPIYWPNVNALEKKDFEYCEKRYNECINLYVKTEYGLMIYFGQQTNYSKRNDFKKQLCKELFSLSKNYYSKVISAGERNRYVFDFYRILELSFIIAENAKLTDEIKEIIEYTFEIHQNWDITKDGTLRVLIDLSCLMSDYFKVFKDKIDFIKVIEKNTQGAQELEKSYLWGAIYIIDRNLLIEQQLKISQENSTRYKAQIYEKMMTAEENRTNNLVALKFAETALRLYQSLKDDAKIGEMNKKYAELRGQIKLTEHVYEIPTEHIKRMSDNIRKTLEKSDEKGIIAHFIFTPWYKSIEQIQKVADNPRNKSFLQDIAGKSILDKFGNTIDTFNSEEEIEIYNFWEAYGSYFQVDTQTMEQFFIESYKAGKLTYETTLEYLETTWYNEPIIRNYNSNQVEIKPIDTLKPSLKSLFKELDLFFADNSNLFDTVTITDSMTLKVESILRNFCEKIGLPTFRTHHKGTEKLVMERLIDELLANVKDSIENPTTFNEDDRLFIKYVLTEKSGLNLRNKIAHGLMDIDDYSFKNIVLVFCIVIKLSRYTFKPIEKKDD